jgi:hypothetical protein
MNITFVSAIVFCASFNSFAGESLLPSILESSMKQALETSSTFGHPIPEGSVKERQKKFSLALADIADQIDAKTAAICASREADAIEFKIVVIALRLKSQPGLFEQIRSEYLYAPLPPRDQISRGGPEFPPLTADIMRDEYRLVWEYFLLWPEQADIMYRSLGDFHTAALNALRRLNSPKSSVVYEYCFSKAAKDDIHGRVWTTESLPWSALLDMIALQRTPEGVRRMLRCLSTLKANPKFYAEVRQHVVGILIGIDSIWIQPYFYGTAPKEGLPYNEWRARRSVWADAIKQIEIEELAPDLQSVLNDALKAPRVE